MKSNNRKAHTLYAIRDVESGFWYAATVGGGALFVSQKEAAKLFEFYTAAVFEALQMGLDPLTWEIVPVTRREATH